MLNFFYIEIRNKNKNIHTRKEQETLFLSDFLQRILEESGLLLTRLKFWGFKECLNFLFTAF